MAPRSTTEAEINAPAPTDRAWRGVAVLAAAAFALRVAFLDRQSLWVDEALSVVFANRPIPDLLHTLVTADIHPPLYPLLLHVWFRIAGTSELAARLPSAVCGTLLVPAAYALARSLAAPDWRIGQWWGLAAAALITVSPFLVYFSQEARNYAAVTLWATLALLFLWRALRDGRRRWWIAYGVATLLAVYTHYNAFLMLVVPPVLFLVGRRRFGAALWPWLVTVGLLALAYLPWTAYALAQLARIDDFWPGTIDPLTVAQRTWLAFSGGHGVWVVPVGALGAALLALGLRPLGHRRLAAQSAALLFLALHFVVPFVLMYALVAFRPKFHARYLIILAPLFYLLLARGLIALAAPGAPKRGWRLRTRRAAASAAAIALAAVSLVGVHAVYTDPAYQREDYRGLVAYVRQHWQPGDVVVLLMDAYQPIVYYGQGTLPYQGLQPYDDQQWTVDRLNEVAAYYRRLWLVLWQEDWADPTRYARHLIEEVGREEPLPVRFHGLGLRLFELPPGARFTVIPRIDHPAEQRFGDDLLFLGWNAPPDAPAGTIVTYDLHWRALHAPQRDVATTVTIRDAADRLVAKADCPTGHWTYPPPRWAVGSVIHSQCPVRLPGYVAPGTYRASANLWDREKAAPVERRDASGRPLPPEQPLGTLRVLPPRPAVAASSSALRLDAHLGPPEQPILVLHGAELTPTLARAGDEVRLTLFWEARTQPPSDYAMEVRLGEALAVRYPTPASREPTSRWPPGAWYVGEVTLRLPAGLRPGAHRITVDLRDSSGRALAGGNVAVGTIYVAN